ncbi:MAG: rod shape-determining protein MreD [Deltaproteobacteria bacterium]
MIKNIKIVLFTILAVILQVAFFPSHLADPFKPNLLMILIVYLGFRSSFLYGGIFAFLLGLLQDSISGLYFGLNGFSSLLIFILLKTVAHRLYADGRAIIVLSVFLATLLNGLLNLLLLLVFSVADGIYSSVFSSIVPQGLMTALISGMVYRFAVSGRREELL